MTVTIRGEKKSERPTFIRLVWHIGVEPAECVVFTAAVCSVAAPPCVYFSAGFSLFCATDWTAGFFFFVCSTRALPTYNAMPHVLTWWQWDITVILTFVNSIFKVMDHGYCYIPVDVVKNSTDFPSKDECQLLTCFLFWTSALCCETSTKLDCGYKWTAVKCCCTVSWTGSETQPLDELNKL